MESGLDKSLSKLVSKGGGTRYWRVHEDVTHVIVWAEEEGRIFLAHPSGPHVVNVTFLLDGLDKGRALDEDDYKVSEVGLGLAKTVDLWL